MYCNNCGYSSPDGSVFCEQCGQDFRMGAYQSPMDNQPPMGGTPPVGNQPPAGNIPPQEPYAYNYYQPPVNYPVQTEKPISIGTYICWTLLAYCLGPISFILTIVFSCISENKSRANFFRAQLVMWALIAVGVVVLAVVFSTIGMALMDEMDYYYYDYILSILPKLGLI